MLKINNLKKFYGSHLALQIGNVEFGEGVYWIKGHNGSGKSTLLKCLAGILSFDGEISYEGFSLKRAPEKYLRCINYSATEPVYPDFLFGTHLLDLFFKCKGENSIHIDPMIECFGMQDYINNQPISQYSSGMLKKLSLLLAFVGNPRLILLDEPFITLDLEASAFLSEWICRFKEKHCTIIMTSHLDSLPFPSEEIELQKGILTN
ncbi:MAG: ABC transporter ATP-binding protein [Sphingobacterium sp.]|jgi:ABC-2 type transport system ATP-binding protein|nr:ABC transporter ATP-binding protein [Sphingobacterium sp.]